MASEEHACSTLSLSPRPSSGSCRSFFYPCSFPGQLCVWPFPCTQVTDFLKRFQIQTQQTPATPGAACGAGADAGWRLSFHFPALANARRFFFSVRVSQASFWVFTGVSVCRSVCLGNAEDSWLKRPVCQVWVHCAAAIPVCHRG